MIDILMDKIIEKKNPSVVGLDPRLSFIPQFIKDEMFERYGKSPKAVAEIYLKFNKMIIDEVYDIVPAIKPQIAMYEQLGDVGIRAYIDTINYAKEKDLVVIGDIKRGDIFSTAESYSEGHIGRLDIEGEKYNIYNQDFITINPYLGYDSIEPYIKDCKEYSKGLFVLVKTSNPNSGQIQDLLVDGKKIYEIVGDLVSQWGQELIGKHGYSLIGAVVGATYPEQGKILRELMANTFFLVPGYGAQGATASDLKACFDKDGLGAIVNSSRGIIAAYKNDKYKNVYSEKEFGKAARQAAIDMKKDLQEVLS